MAPGSERSLRARSAATTSPSGSAAALRAAPGTRSWRPRPIASRPGARRPQARRCRCRRSRCARPRGSATGLEEMDRVLGGGLMRGSAVLVGGEPGIGKSTLMLQLAASLEGEGRVLYVSGEESAGQLRLRADRLGVTRERVEVLCETGLEPIRETMARLKPSLTIVDSDPDPRVARAQLARRHGDADPALRAGAAHPTSSSAARASASSAT